ncbi:MFS siderochrome iron transporter 1 [Pseudogymnoascus australis]
MLPERSERVSSLTVSNDDSPPATAPQNENNDSNISSKPPSPFNSHSDMEAQEPPRQAPASHWSLVIDQTHITPEVMNHPYRGSGTVEDPYVVEWIPNDRRNPMDWPQWKKWAITMTMAFATLAVSLVSSAYTGGVKQIAKEFNVSSEVITLGVSLFVLGFAIGPLFWAPLSEMYGRQILFLCTYAMLTTFNAGAAGANSMATLLIFRFFGGAFGSSPLTNAGGVIADMFSADDRGLAMSLFASAPFLGPCLGPITGGFLGEAAGWRWVEGYLAIFSGTLWIIGSLVVPETYAPVLLRRRANKLSKRTGKAYKTSIDIRNGDKSLGSELKVALSRPWKLLFTEPIVLAISIFMAIVYGTMYMCFAAFPIVYQEGRNWSEGIGGLAFLGILVGMLIAVSYSIYDNARSPPPALIGSLALPIGLFWFAWTNSPSLHWSISIIGTAPFGFGMVLVFLGSMNYLIDAYTIYAASVLAASSVLRSLFGAAFPLFASYMYDSLGIHWASSVPAFLAVLCIPAPFLFYKYGESIRLKCKYAAESAEFMRLIREKENDTKEKGGVLVPRDEDGDGVGKESDEDVENGVFVGQNKEESS